MSAADRQRRRRKLRKAGRSVWPLELDDADVEAALEEAGLISSMAETPRQKKVAALTAMVSRTIRDRHA